MIRAHGKLNIGLWLVLAACPLVRADDALERGFADPPREARLRAYWWWLNGNVTAAAITRDLQEMAEKGFGGALICDAGGAEQDGNDPVPHGPTFFTPPWRELYRHALREADRLGLEMSLNIQSGWNLGGPMVKPADAPKRLVWSDTRVQGPGPLRVALPEPLHEPAFYRDVAVVAWPVLGGHGGDATLEVTAGSQQPVHVAADAVDGSPHTFWVSGGVHPGDGPTPQRPEWIRFRFDRPVSVHGLRFTGRPGYGPRRCELQASDDGRTWQVLASFEGQKEGETSVRFDPTRAGSFRLLILDAFDAQDGPPRNVQIVEIALEGPDGPWPRRQDDRRIRHFEHKTLDRVLGRSAPDTSPLFDEAPSVPGEEHLHAASLLDLTGRMGPDGTLEWDAPEGTWEILRFGCTLNRHCRVNTNSQGWDGYAIDPFDAGIFRSYWNEIVEPLIADAGPLAGRTLAYLHTDSWEIEAANWTATLPQEFRRRRGYDLLPFLPAIAGRIVDSREITNRYLHDFRKTLGDLAVDNHFRLFRENAHRHGLRIHPESGGPHAVPIDSLRCLGLNDAPMSEFWSRSWRHRVTDEDRFFVKQPASAAHTCGRRFVLAEGFTNIGPHWQETLSDNLKPSFDRACCEGLNLLVWHAFTCSPAEMGLPGQQYFAGTHLDPGTTWWNRSGPFLAYLNRCQFLLQQGLFVADVVYYYGDHVPNFARLKASDPAGVLPGFDYDVATEEVVLTRMSVRDGRIVLPDGMSYRLLVLPPREAISLPVLEKIRELVHAGATVVGPRPRKATGLQDYPACDDRVARLAEELWPREPGQASVGRGRVISGRPARQVLLDDGVPPDLEYVVTAAGAATRPVEPGTPVLDFIHRRDGETDIYFVVNLTEQALTADVLFRVGGKAPELWDAVTGHRRRLAVWSPEAGRTRVPLEFAPCGSWFILFRQPAGSPPAQTPDGGNFPRLSRLAELTGPWTVRFDPRWGGPESVEFPSLVCWTQRPEPGIRFYSGTAFYEKTFDLPDAAGTPGSRLYLDLGNVRQLAAVTLNGRDLGVLWAWPLRVEITDAVQPAGNRLRIEVVNCWANRVIGDAALAPEQRLTRTNIRKLTADSPLMDSGLLGPVTLLQAVPP